MTQGKNESLDWILGEKSQINEINADTRKRKLWTFVKLDVLEDRARAAGHDREWPPVPNPSRPSLYPRKPSLLERLGVGRREYLRVEEQKRNLRRQLARDFFRMQNGIVEEMLYSNGSLVLAIWVGKSAVPDVPPHW